MALEMLQQVASRYSRYPVYLQKLLISLSQVIFCVFLISMLPSILSIKLEEAGVHSSLQAPGPACRQFTPGRLRGAQDLVPHPKTCGL